MNSTCASCALGLPFVIKLRYMQTYSYKHRACFFSEDSNYKAQYTELGDHLHLLKMNLLRIVTLMIEKHPSATVMDVVENSFSENWHLKGKILPTRLQKQKIIFWHLNAVYTFRSCMTPTLVLYKCNLRFYSCEFYKKASHHITKIIFFSLKSMSCIW